MDQHAPQPGAEGLAEPLRSRWSPSVYDDSHRLTSEEVETLLRAAQWAPSRGNSQPWTFFVCEPGTPQHDALVATLTRGNAGWVPRASLVLVSAAHVRTAEEPESEQASPFALHDVGQAAAHVTLQARAMGLHAHQFAGFDHDALAEALGVPATHDLLAGIAVGVLGDPEDVDERTAARDDRDRVRRPLAEWAFAGRFGDAWIAGGAAGGVADSQP
ncbi:nitroreductase family protein [Nocardioides hwasunensis]|uniref:Nitroreductase family protein n=1 Tax=Nocardioides hwasunensis TaxID=397258 RepID=A0ABR8MNH4_9ACTN|nr:nitroreductase family protein [Nocardioides hwasunensis]MBD3916350.1 nitroreductase family protein [Nocardioides hwasunensis]